MKVIDYNFTASQDGVKDTTHRLTSGHLVKGIGSAGASYKLRKYVSVTPSTTVFTEDFPPFKWSDDCANPGTDGWCQPIPAPDEIDLEEIDGGACKPRISGSSCPLVGHGVGELALNIVGAAGENVGGVPGSLLLAVIVNEQEWLYWYEMENNVKKFLPLLMNWDDESIASYSEPFSARITNCGTQTFSAQGPYGFTTFDTGNTFENYVLPYGFHPSRGSSKYVLDIVSQCNFIDASYAAAAGLKAKDNNLSCNSDLNENQVRDILASWWGGGHTGDEISQDAVDIAVNCQ